MTTTPVAARRGGGPAVTPRHPAIYYIAKALNVLLLAVIGIILLAPFILAFLGTFKTDAEIIAYPPDFIPRQWQWQNWPRLWATDFGGTPQARGTTSLGLVTGLLVFLLIFLAIGLRAEARGRLRLPRNVGLYGTLALTIAANVAVFLYLRNAFGSLPLALTVSISFEFLMLMIVILIALSKPTWERVLLSAAISLAIGVGATVLISFIAQLAGGGRFIRWMLNIAVLAIVFAFLEAIFCSMAAYAFARLRFPGKGLIFGFMLASMMIPSTVTLIPSYVLIAKIDWVNTAYSLIIPGITSAFGIFLLTQFLRTIPHELEEAAVIDGASYFQIYRDIILPLARPALLTLFILQFQSMWNNFMTPLLYLNTPDMWVLNVALSTFQQQYKAQWNLTLVGAMINAFPVLVIFFFFSRFFIQGVGRSGLKE